MMLFFILFVSLASYFLNAYNMEAPRNDNSTYFEQTTHHLTWADGISIDTSTDSWGTWDTFYRQTAKPSVDHDAFKEAVRKGSYQELSIQAFLDLNVENHRLAQYVHARTAEEAYPINDRPRGTRDIESVNYLLNTTDPISPICVARVSTESGIRYIKLDGVHRLIAAAISESKIRILFIDL